MEGTAATAAPVQLGADAVALLQRLIRANTVNPPGNEGTLASGLGDLLESAGFECELLAAVPERPNLVARLRGDSDGPTLTLLGHLDTVRADPEEWTRDPWSGEVADGEVWGRGALDMKGQVAAELAACLELARSGWRPASGELLLVLTADEEAGGKVGARWLCEQHPEKVRSDMVVNEGGGSAIELEGKRLYTLSVGEKGVFRVRLLVNGLAGHASLPRVGDNALLKLAALVASLDEQPEEISTPEALGFLSTVLGEPVEASGLGAALERLRGEQPQLAAYLGEPLAGITISPTIARAGEKANVIPSSAEVLLDCRVPPGLGEPEVRESLRALLGEDGYELEFIEAIVGTRSPERTALADAVREWVAEGDPGAEVVPVVMTGFSDSHWFRSAFADAAIYGFCPQRTRGLLDAAPLIHGADERIPVADVELAARFFFELPSTVLG